MEATQRPYPLHGLSEFLVEHEACGEGFDIAHPGGVGNGRISMTCRKCGETFDYSLDTIEVEREIEFTPATAGSTAPPSVTELPSKPAQGSDEEKPPGPAKSDGGDGKKSGHSTRDRVAIATLLVLAIGAIAFAAIRVSENRDGGSGEEAAVPSQPATSAPDSSVAPQPGAPPVGGTPQAAKPPRNVKVVGTSLYALIVPDDWTSSDESGGKLYSPPGSQLGSVLVFTDESSALSSQEMTERTAEFLTSQTPGGSLEGPRPLRVDGEPAFELRDVGPTGSQTARGVFAEPNRFLLIANFDKGIPPRLRGQVQRALDSFQVR